MTDQLMQGDGAFRRSNPKAPISENTFAGALSFMRRSYRRELEDVDLVISGIPLDLATTFRSGARLGPQAIRAASVQLAELLPFPWGFDPFATLSVVDYGDCWLDPHHPETIHDAIVAHAAGILASGARMLTLGGDHYVTYPLLEAHARHFGTPLALIHFDAHSDTWAEPTARALNHGTMFTQALRDGLIDPDRSIQIGIRTWNEETRGLEILTAPWVHEHGANAVIDRIRHRVGDAPAYLTFDIDCLDPAFAPGTGTPVAGGLSSAQALAILRGLTDLHLVGMDVVEVAPAYDQSEITALAAAHVACDLVCLMAARRGALSAGEPAP
jgi:agmatinase